MLATVALVRGRPLSEVWPWQGIASVGWGLTLCRLWAAAFGHGGNVVSSLQAAIATVLSSHVAGDQP